MEEEKEEQRIQWHASQLDDLCKTLKDIKSRLQRGEYRSKAFYEKMSKVLKSHHSGFKAVQNDQLFDPELLSSREKKKTGHQTHSWSRNSSDDEDTTGSVFRARRRSRDTTSVEKGRERNVERNIKSCSVILERLAASSASAPPRRRNRRYARKENFVMGLQDMKSLIEQQLEEFGDALLSGESDSDASGCSEYDDSGTADESSGDDDMEAPESCQDALVDVAPSEVPPSLATNGNDFISPVSTGNVVEPYTEEQEPVDDGKIADGEADVKLFGPNGGRRNIRPIRETLLPETEAAVKKEVERNERIAARDAAMEEILVTENEEGDGRHFVLDFDPATNEPAVMLDPTLVPKLKDYQLDGIKFMYDNCFESIGEYSRPESEGGGCVLAHCMGLGKTFQVVAFVHTILTCRLMNVKRVMVLCPPTTVDNWAFEFQTWLHECRENIVIHNFVDMKSKTIHKRVNFLQNWYDSGAVLITSYSFFRATLTQNNVLPQTMEKIHQLLLSPGADCVVCDEGHILKSSDSKLVHLLHQVRTRRRVILTGTPLQNNLMEYYTMLDFVKPNLLGSAAEFRNRFINPIKNGQHSDSTNEDAILMKKRSYVLYKLVENGVHRLGYSTLVPLLQPKYEYCILLRPSELQKKLYNGYLKFIGPAKARLSQNKFFGDFTQLSKIMSHPINLTYTTAKKGSACCWWQQYVTSMEEMAQLYHSNKFLVLFDIIDYCVAEGDKIVVFSQYKYTLDIIEEALQTNHQEWRKNIDYYRLDGDTASEKRQKMVDDFNRPESCAKLFLLSTRAGGVGINLVSANRVVIFDASFNPAIDVQAVFRTYRLGQVKPCYVYRLLTGGTMEEAVYRQQVTKLSLAERVVDEQNPERHFKEDEFINMYAPVPADIPSDMLSERPEDRVLEKVLRKWRRVIQTHLNHKDLLENQDEINLTEEDKQAALLEYRECKDQRADHHGETSSESAPSEGVASEIQNWQEIMTQFAEIFDQPEDAHKKNRQGHISGSPKNKEPVQSQSMTIVEPPPQATDLAEENPEDGPFYSVPVPPSPKQPPPVITLDGSSNEGEEISCLEDRRTNDDGIGDENVANLSRQFNYSGTMINCVPSSKNQLVPPAGISESPNEKSGTRRRVPHAVDDSDLVSNDPSNANASTGVSDALVAPVKEYTDATNIDINLASPRSSYDDFEYEESPSEEDNKANVVVRHTKQHCGQENQTEKYRFKKRRKTGDNEACKKSDDAQEELDFDSTSKRKAVQNSDSYRTNNPENGSSIPNSDSAQAHSLEKVSAPGGDPVTVSASDTNAPGQIASLSNTHSQGSNSKAISMNKRASLKARLGPKVAPFNENQNEEPDLDESAKKDAVRRIPSPIKFPTEDQCKNETVEESNPRAKRSFLEMRTQEKSHPNRENWKGSRSGAPTYPRGRQLQTESRGRGRGSPPRQGDSRLAGRLRTRFANKNVPSTYDRQHHSDDQKSFRDYSSGQTTRNRQTVPGEGNDRPVASRLGWASSNNYENTRPKPLLMCLRPALLPTPGVQEARPPFYVERDPFNPRMFPYHSHTRSRDRNFNGENNWNSGWK